MPPYGRVASFEEMKMDKIGLASLIGTAYYQSIEMSGNNGLPMAEMLMRRVMLNYEIESWISPYIPEANEYWKKSGEAKKYLTAELARMPQYHTQFIQKLAAWNQLLMKEEARMNLLLTRNVAARV